MRTLIGAFVVMAGSLLVGEQAWAGCGILKPAKIGGAEITMVRSIGPGGFRAPDQSGVPAAVIRELPAFCRVVGVIRPSADSKIGFELWLPDQWNGRYLQTGNGGFAGIINYGGLAPALRNGFAVASTDDGHTGRDAVWALGHPQKVVDFGYRALHLTAVTAEEIVTRYYGRRYSHAYFSGCSDGGRESLMEAQRYPDDFDGWLVGAPANDFTGVMTYLLHLAQVGAAMPDPLTPSQIVALSNAALARCDSQDGTKDGVIDDPPRCQFDPAELQCKRALDGKCLTAAQVVAVRAIYEDAVAAGTQARLTPGFRSVLGDEVGQWPLWIGPVPKHSGLSAPLSQFFAEQFFPYMVYGDPKLDLRKVDLLRAAEDGRRRVGMELNAMDPDLSAVRASGKKIIQYHGSADGVIPPRFSISYYGAVEKYLGRDNRDFYRLFIVPGMEHCGGGPGPDAFGAAHDPRPYGAGYDAKREFDPASNILAALVRWVENGRPPERIVATKYRDNDPSKGVVRTQPLCVYPGLARWTGRGSPNDARNFVCSIEK